MSLRPRPSNSIPCAPDFVSSPAIAATGAAQNVAHGLGAVPFAVLVVPTDGHNGAGAAGTQFPTLTQGAHTSTNVVVTVTAGAKFQVLAWRQRGKGSPS